jgi:hypothetical protein
MKMKTQPDDEGIGGPLVPDPARNPICPGPVA